MPEQAGKIYKGVHLGERFPKFTAVISDQLAKLFPPTGGIDQDALQQHMEEARQREMAPPPPDFEFHPEDDDDHQPGTSNVSPTPQTQQEIEETTPQRPPTMPRLGVDIPENFTPVDPDIEDMITEMGPSMPYMDRLNQIRRNLFTGQEDEPMLEEAPTTRISVDPGEERYNANTFEHTKYFASGDRAIDEDGNIINNPPLSEPEADADAETSAAEAAAEEGGLPEDAAINIDNLIHNAYNYLSNLNHKHPVIHIKMASTPPISAAGGVGNNPNAGGPVTFPADLGQATNETYCFKKRHRFIIYNNSPDMVARELTMADTIGTTTNCLGYLYALGYYEIPDLHPSFYMSIAEFQDIMRKSTHHKFTSASWKIVQTDLQHLAESNPTAATPQQYAQNPPQPNIYIFKKPSETWHGRLRHWGTTVQAETEGPTPATVATVNNRNGKVAEVIWLRDARLPRQLPVVTFVQGKPHALRAIEMPTNIANGTGRVTRVPNPVGISGTISDRPIDLAGLEHELPLSGLIGLERSVTTFKGWRVNHPALIPEKNLLLSDADLQYNLDNPAGDYATTRGVNDNFIQYIGSHWSRAVRPFLRDETNANEMWPNVNNAAIANYNCLIGQDFSNTQTCRWENPYEAATYHISPTSQQHEPTFIRMDYLLPYKSYQPLSRLEIIIEATLCMESRDARWNRMNPLIVQNQGNPVGAYNMMAGYKVMKDTFYSPILYDAMKDNTTTSADVSDLPGCGAGVPAIEGFPNNPTFPDPVNILSLEANEIDPALLPDENGGKRNKSKKLYKRKHVEI